MINIFISKQKKIFVRVGHATNLRAEKKN